MIYLNKSGLCLGLNLFVIVGWICLGQILTTFYIREILLLIYLNTGGSAYHTSQLSSRGFQIKYCGWAIL